MNTSSETTANCLCGKVTLHIKNVPNHVHACHCNTCRQWTGSPLFAVDCGQDVTISGEEHVKAYRSSDWAERAFCTHCGSHLFSRLIEAQQYFVMAGLLNIDKEVHFQQEFFIDEKPNYYTFSNDTKQLTGEELFALFAGESSRE